MNGEFAAADVELMSGFCSLGHDCEFGIAQRSIGAQPIDLLRWASIDMPSLLALLEARFEGLGNDLELLPCEPGKELMVRSPRFDFIWHAGVRSGQMEPAAVIAR